MTTRPPTAMYHMLMCQSPLDVEPALLSYDPDELPDGRLRTWKTGKRFASPPPQPVKVWIDEGESGWLKEYNDATVALMSRRLAQALVQAGVSNIEFYEAVVEDFETGEVHRDHLAFNLIGVVAAADLGRSVYQALDGPVISVDFDSLALDEAKAQGALMFRLAEAVTGVVVHDRVKQAIEAAGIDTLTFLPPEQWVG